LWDVPAAVQTAVADARRLRERGYRVFAYGDSAGGTLAALLADRGLVRAAVANEPPSNLIEWPGYYSSDDEWQAWLNLDRRDRARLSGWIGSGGGRPDSRRIDRRGAVRGAAGGASAGPGASEWIL
jgi:acetyl esterase/lipase